MGNLVNCMVIIIVLCAGRVPFSFAKPCSSENDTISSSQHQEPLKNCDEKLIPKEDKGESSTDTDGFGSRAVYTIVVAAGVILIPLIVFARICWLRKLQTQRNNAVNEVRRIVDQRLEEEQERRNAIFSIDLANIPFEDIFGKPPSYEECLTNPSTGCPPPYDPPPSYSQKQSDMNNQNTEQTEDNDQLPSSSSSGET